MIFKWVTIMKKLITLLCLLLSIGTVSIQAYSEPITKVGDKLISLYESTRTTKWATTTQHLVNRTHDIINSYYYKDDLVFEARELLQSLQRYLMDAGYFDMNGMNWYHDDNLWIQLLVPDVTKRRWNGEVLDIQIVTERESSPYGDEGSIHIKPMWTTLEEFPARNIQIKKVDHNQKDEMIDRFIKEHFGEWCAYAWSLHMIEWKEYQTVSITDESVEIYGEYGCIINYIQHFRYYEGETHDTLVQRSIGHDANFGIDQRSFDSTMSYSLQIVE